ncbi:MAG: HAMP domain-containing histidine kinase [Flintibacter sp.]|uniref:sensor histidine kinase n=1 Tax=Flintibacter porci TaxID=3342383 RepID=UPI003F8C625E|nr:HAMP domain-containing histidine kinase [Flintibacter sp.]
MGVGAGIHKPTGLYPHCKKGISLQQQIEPAVSVRGNLDKAEQVIGILLDNAGKYTNTGGTIEVCLHRQKKYAVLTVSNTGEGIPPEHMDKIFDRFYRVDHSRKHTGSYGLGLSIAKALVEQMGASLSVCSVPHQKTTFTIRWEST